VNNKRKKNNRYNFEQNLPRPTQEEKEGKREGMREKDVRGEDVRGKDVRGEDVRGESMRGEGTKEEGTREEGSIGEGRRRGKEERERAGRRVKGSTYFKRT